MAWQVLELGIVAHSVIIGMSLGASDNPNTVRPLLGALTFHQFFEGIGLGGCIAQVPISLFPGNFSVVRVRLEMLQEL